MSLWEYSANPFKLVHHTYPRAFDGPDALAYRQRAVWRLGAALVGIGTEIVSISAIAALPLVTPDSVIKGFVAGAIVGLGTGLAGYAGAVHDVETANYIPPLYDSGTRPLPPEAPVE